MNDKEAFNDILNLIELFKLAKDIDADELRIPKEFFNNHFESLKVAIQALNFKMEVERFADEEEWPEYFDAKCRELIEQIKEGSKEDV